MIRFAKKEDVKHLKELCISLLSAKEKTFLEYYFDHIFQESNALVCELDEKLVSQIHTNEHILHLNGKQLIVSHLIGLTTHYDYRNRGIMRDLLDLVISDCANNHLLTFCEAYNPKLVKKYGFEVFAIRKRYVIYAKELRKMSDIGIFTHVSAQEMCKVYKRFANVFDAYYERDERYYKERLRMERHCGYKVCAYFDQGEIRGYCIYAQKDDAVEVKEIVYLDSVALMKMLSYVIKGYAFVSVEVSEKERLEKIFKLNIPRAYNHLMVRVNNVRLYNQLFHCNIKNTKEFVQEIKKPILLHERY